MADMEKETRTAGVIADESEIVLSTGKRVKKRELKGQHHFIESRLLSACAVSLKGTNANIGDLVLASEVKTAIAIEKIDGERMKMPETLADVYVLAGKFTYEEWDELKIAMQPSKEKVEKMVKKLQENTGSDSE